ncbi:MAG TPA: hypothetical protein VM367_01915 [Pseudonocardia sp.]|jgi:hypothetical protein|nr:hypothetical protein [Pseudonocardia sp.]
MVVDVRARGVCWLRLEAAAGPSLVRHGRTPLRRVRLRAELLALSGGRPPAHPADPLSVHVLARNMNLPDGGPALAPPLTLEQRNGTALPGHEIA